MKSLDNGHFLKIPKIAGFLAKFQMQLSQLVVGVETKLKDHFNRLIQLYNFAVEQKL
jgi:hypothetical protein